MSKVGTVVFSDKDYAEGFINTRTMQMQIRLVKNEDRQGDNSPDFVVQEKLIDGRIVEIGNAWKQKAQGGTGQEYLSMAMDDPSFPMMLNVSAFKIKGKPDEWDIIWSRPKAKVAA